MKIKFDPSQLTLEDCATTLVVLAEQNIMDVARKIIKGCGNEHRKVIHCILNNAGFTTDSNTDLSTALQFAAGKGKIGIVRLLLTYPEVDPTAKDNLAIQLAAQEGHLKVVELLLTCPGVDPCADRNYAIRKASAIGHIEIVKLLFTHLPKSDKNYFFQWANANRLPEVVLLIAKIGGFENSNNKPSPQFFEEANRPRQSDKQPHSNVSGLGS